MSGRIVGEILDNAPEDLTRLQLQVLIALAESARDTTRVATHKTTKVALAYRCRTTPDTVKNALRALRERGLITPTNGHAHKGKAQHWHVTKLTADHRRAVMTGGPHDTPSRDP